MRSPKQQMKLRKDLARDSGLTHEAIARRIGCSRSTVWRLLNETEHPHPGLLEAFAKALGITVADMS